MSLYKHENGVHFRKADKGDARTLLCLKNESHFGTHTVTLANLTSQEAWLNSISHETHCPRDLVLMASAERPNHQFSTDDFGVIKLFNIDWQSRRAEIGWDVFKEFRRKGYGKKLVTAGVTFAFKLMNLHRLDAQILVTNEASLKCAEAAGFIIEGRQRQVVLKEGKYIDNLILGVLNESNI
jgi:RimJ/RimL family protein N-acetyltransferase